MAISKFEPLYLLMIPLIWIALAYGLSGISLGVAAINFGTTLALLIFHFDVAKLGEIQLLMLIICASSLLTGAVVTERKEVGEMLRASQSRFQNLFELSPDAIVVTNHEGKIVQINQQAEKVFGYSADELIGHFVEALIPEHFRENHPRERAGYMMEPHQRPMGIRPGSFLGRRKDNSQFPVDISLGVLTTETGLLVVATVRDVTERKLAEQELAESEKRFRALVEHSMEEISLVSANGTLIYESPNSRRPLGYAPDSFVGHNLFELFHPEDRAAAAQTLQQVIRQPGNNRDALFRLRHQDGSWRWMEGILTNLLDEPAVRAVVINYRDVTERQHAEQELKQRLADFEAVNQLSSAMRVAQTLDELLPIVLNVTLEVLHAPGGIVWLYDRVRDELRAEATRGYDTQDGVSPLQPEKPGEGIAGYVFATREPFIEKDFHLSPRLPENIRRDIPPGIAAAVIPIRAADHVIGALSINVPQSREWTPNEIHLLTILSEIAGNAIQRTMLNQQTKLRLQHLAALSEIDRSIISSFDLLANLNTVLTQAIAELEIHAADVYLFDPGSQILKYCVGQGFHSSTMETPPIDISEEYAGRAVLERRMINITNLNQQLDVSARTALFVDEAFVSYYAVPLIAKGEVKGVLEIFKRAPFDPDEEWFDFLNTLAGQAAIAIDNAMLFDGLQRSNLELSQAYDATIEGWSHALDLRDKETEGHTQRVTEMTLRLARVFNLGEAELAQIRWGALLHDIGKMGVPDAILLKPGPLTDEEWLVMRKHPIFAHDMLLPIKYLRAAVDIPYCHHEKWDGTGYPRGLKGDQIPFAARLFAVIDVWDALTSDRPYRAAWSVEKVRDHIHALAGTHFDPEVVKICLESDVLKAPKDMERL